MNEAEKQYQESVEAGANRLAEAIDNELIADMVCRAALKKRMVHAGAMMSDKGYSEGSLDNPQFIESQKRYQAIFDELKNDQSRS